METFKLGKHEVQIPAVCGAVMGPDIETMQAGATRAIDQGADLIELRIDGLHDPTGWEKLLPLKLPVILTNRPDREGGGFKGDENERVEVLLQGIERGVSCIDIELSTPEPLRKRVTSQAKKSGIAVLMSHHDFSLTPSIDVLTEMTKRLTGTGCDLAKIVTFAKDRMDALRILDFLAQVQDEVAVPLIAFAMGDAGKITRIAAPIFGSPIVYAAAGEATAPGQFDVATMKRLLSELIPEGR
ncbi:MAG: type I 3-dehydroquinate dehydratase [Candidatus Hadarchaeaceae archaeon]